MFKIGDKVKVIAAETFTERIGKRGEVVDSEGLSSLNATNYKIQFSADRNDYNWFQPAKLELVEMKIKKHNNLIEVDYQELPNGLVKITAIRNLLTWDKLEEKYGMTTAEEYRSGDHIIKCSGGCHEIFCGEEKALLSLREIPAIVSSDFFKELIQHMKKSGENLCRIAREERAKEIPVTKTITI